MLEKKLNVVIYIYFIVSAFSPDDQRANIDVGHIGYRFCPIKRLPKKKCISPGGEGSGVMVDGWVG